MQKFRLGTLKIVFIAKAASHITSLDVFLSGKNLIEAVLFQAGELAIAANLLPPHLMKGQDQISIAK